MSCLGVMDGVGGAIKRIVYQEVMVGKQCRNAHDFVNLIEQKNTSILIDELLTSEIKHGRDGLKLIFDKVKAVPSIQKVHSMTVVDIDKIECKVYSHSEKKPVVNF